MSRYTAYAEERLRGIYTGHGVRVVQVLDEHGSVYDPAYVQLRDECLDGSANWVAPSQVKDWRRAAKALALGMADLQRQGQEQHDGVDGVG